MKTEDKENIRLALKQLVECFNAICTEDETDEHRQRKSQSGRWFRWSRHGAGEDFIVSLVQNASVARYAKREHAEMAIADLDALVREYISDTKGRVCEKKIHANGESD